MRRRRKERDLTLALRLGERGRIGDDGTGLVQDPNDDEDLHQELGIEDKIRGNPKVGDPDPSLKINALSLQSYRGLGLAEDQPPRGRGQEQRKVGMLINTASYLKALAERNLSTQPEIKSWLASTLIKTRML